MNLANKNKILTEQLEQADKTIVALMNQTTKYQENMFGLKHKLKQCEKIVNNVLYFDDNSDYSTALWQVLNITQDRSIYDDCYDIKLAYMEGE